MHSKRNVYIKGPILKFKRTGEKKKNSLKGMNN